MSTVRQIDDIFSSEAKGIRLVKALVEFYKASEPDVQQALEPGMYSLVSAIQTNLRSAAHRESLETFLAEEGMASKPQ